MVLPKNDLCLPAQNRGSIKLSFVSFAPWTSPMPVAISCATIMNSFQTCLNAIKVEILNPWCLPMIHLSTSSRLSLGLKFGDHLWSGMACTRRGF
jgi:hypothetical protein